MIDETSANQPLDQVTTPSIECGQGESPPRVPTPSVFNSTEAWRASIREALLLAIVDCSRR